MTDHHADLDGRRPDEDELDRRIDAIRTGQTAGPHDVDTLLSRVHALADDPLPPDTRILHLARIRTHAPARRRRRAVARAAHWRRRLVPVAAAVSSLMLLAATSAVAASRDAGPDDALYGVKRASERVWASLPRGAEQAAEVRLVIAERRLAEARSAPAHAEQLVADGVAAAEQAADERPDEAIETLSRLLGDGEGSLPPQASPRARVALHRNCVRMAQKRGLDASPCGDAPEDVHPGRGRGLGSSDETSGPPGLRDREPGPPDQHPGRGLGRPGDDERGPRGWGWGPGGRPEGETGPPHGRGDDEAGGPPPHARGWGPGGRPEGWVGPPPGAPPGQTRGPRPERDADANQDDSGD